LVTRKERETDQHTGFADLQNPYFSFCLIQALYSILFLILNSFQQPNSSLCSHLPYKHFFMNQLSQKFMLSWMSLNCISDTHTVTQELPGLEAEKLHYYTYIVCWNSIKHKRNWDEWQWSNTTSIVHRSSDTCCHEPTIYPNSLS
jgi:hypothetical protein